MNSTPQRSTRTQRSSRKSLTADVGGRETTIEEMVAEAEQMGINAVIGVDVDYESIQIGQGGSMEMVSASGTAVKL
jgi:uncharacterized protein YbjQ (UPF0145 family)